MTNRSKKYHARKHHITPRSRGGKDAESNIMEVDERKHSLWHQIFSNLKPDEVIMLINYWTIFEGSWDRGYWNTKKIGDNLMSLLNKFFNNSSPKEVKEIVYKEWWYKKEPSYLKNHPLSRKYYKEIARIPSPRIQRKRR